MHINVLATAVDIAESIRHSEIHRKTCGELVSNGILGRNLRTKQKVSLMFCHRDYKRIEAAKQIEQL